MHIDDVCTAAWAAATWVSDPTNSPTASTTASDRAFNITDDGDTTQQTLADLIHQIFHIETGFQGTIISQFAKLNLDSVVDDVNEDILQPWADLLKKAGLDEGPGSPLSPFMEKELIKDCNLALSNGKAKEAFGWTVQRRELTVEGIRDVVGSYERMRWWP